MKQHETQTDEEKEYTLEEAFKKADKIKPKYNLTAEQMDELCENRLLKKMQHQSRKP